MRILLMVKQVPDTNTNLLDESKFSRKGPMVLNPQCEYALDAAAALKGDGRVVAFTMGPSKAQHALFRCLELGADYAYHLCDSDFAGSDVWATANTLSKAIMEFEPEFDIILCGGHAADAETGLLPTMLAAALGIPVINRCQAIRYEGGSLIANRERNGIPSELIVPSKSLVSMIQGSNVHRLPSLKDLQDARAKQIETLDRGLLGLRKDECGASGSFTKVDAVFAADHSREGVELVLDDTDTALDLVIDVFQGDEL